MRRCDKTPNVEVRWLPDAVDGIDVIAHCHRVPRCASDRPQQLLDAHPTVMRYLQRRLPLPPFVAPVVFFDVDGVVALKGAYRERKGAGLIEVPEATPEWFASILSPAHVERFERICAATAAEGVLVSSWREWLPFNVIVEAFQRLGCDSVRGRVDGASRIGGVRAWVGTRRPPAWVILDDEREHWQGDAAALARLVTPTDGLTDDDVRAALAVLLNQEMRVPQ